MFMLHIRTKFYVSVFLPSPIIIIKPKYIYRMFARRHIVLLHSTSTHNVRRISQNSFSWLTAHARMHASANACARLRGEHGDHMNLHF